jgi:RNA polymerase sigma-70 factor (ECF subfamily)
MESKGCIQDCLLVREAQGANQAAFEQLVRTHDQAVLGLALRITGSGSSGHPSRSISESLQEPRWLPLRVRLLDSGLPHCHQPLLGPPTREESRATAVAPRIKCTHHTGALKRLTPRERMVFELKHFQGLKVRTIGEILNSSEGAVKNSLFRETQKLRFHLAMYTNGNNSSIKQRGVNGVNQAAVLQQEKKLATTSTPTLNSSITELRPATVNRIVLRETLQRLFSSQGCEVDVVPDGAGLETLSQRPILGLQHTETARM